jgi:hypothetical protein
MLRNRSSLSRIGAGMFCSFGLFAAAGASLISSALAAPVNTAGPPRVDFDRDVRPILAENCYKCHGFDAKTRQADLRLDVREEATRTRPSRRRAVAPRSAAASELLRRVALTGHGRMPPESAGKALSAAQIATLRRWIEAGAGYAQHWSFVPPRRLDPPSPRSTGWVRNPIDRFILARLEAEKLSPSPEADRTTLCRRVSLDLTGLPPTPREIATFLGDTRPGAYERMVDRYLASPHYGERMAVKWLDLARYADTHGYHIDSHRDMWLWRDWVIRAFNENKPFDQFTIEQLAGDLLPNPTRDQRIATGFNRNHPINFEGGAIPEEYQAAYIFDRIDTTATTWMALTMRCGQCHDHKYDPLTQKDFYRFYAFFNNVPEKGLDGTKGNAVPFLKVASTEQEAGLAEADRKIAEMDGAVKARAAAAAPARAAWEIAALSTAANSPEISSGLLARYALDESEGSQIGDSAGGATNGRVRGTVNRAPGKFGNALWLDGSSYAELGGALGFERTDAASYGAWVNPRGSEAMTMLSRMDDADNHRGWDLYLQDGKVYVHLIHRWEQDAIRVNTRQRIEVNKWSHVFATYDGGSKASGIRIYIDGKAADLEVTHDRLTGTIRTEKPAVIGRRTPGAPFRGGIDDVRIYGRALAAHEVAQIAGFDAILHVLRIARERRSADQQATVEKYYLETFDPEYQRAAAELASWRQKRTEIEAAIPNTMVMEELPQPRPTHILVRGQYNRPGEAVTAGLPAVLATAGTGPGQRLNRLDLARWLVGPNHPLTARVAVNRYWEMYFGAGLVRTAENFGIQGERPSHPELLDWLATEFIRTGWDVKAMQKLILTSSSYRQSARVTPELKRRDPENRLVARGPRQRLSAEFIRDQALAVSGLLVPAIGGPSVKPYHPAGLWEEMAFGGGFTAQKYEQDHGDKLYRRSMYTFWKRTVPPPTMQTFDAPDREVCIVRRSVTNTPLQALVLLNDPTYIEASRKLAERVLTEVAASPADRIRYAYRLLMCRQPAGHELRVLLGLYETQLAAYRKDPEAAKKLLAVGEAKRDERLQPAEAAAWTSVMSVMLNLDEAISKN